MSEGIELLHTCGYCPVQIEGTVDGVPFYFRARGQRWQLGVGEDPVGVTLGIADGYYREEPWGDGRFAAGYMPLEVAEGIVLKELRDYRESNVEE